MKIGIFSTLSKSESLTHYLNATIEYLKNNNYEFIIDQRVKKIIPENQQNQFLFFDPFSEIHIEIDVLFTIGGDGTLLRAIPFIKKSEIPILGINTGRLGFLTSLNKESLNKGLDLFFKKKFTLVDRKLLKVESSLKLSEINNFPFAINELTINRKNTSSMLSIKTIIVNKLLATYWSDGLIISTPTGSTGYSLSSGGPILTPSTSAFVLNPIAPHNINIRPLVIPDSSKIEIQVFGRSKKHLLSLDDRKTSIMDGCKLLISKAPFIIKTVQLKGDDFFKTLQDKLFWGLDKRNRQ